MQLETSRHAFAREIAVLFHAALIIFVFTVTVGILNGTDLVDFDQKTILTHVHTGTLGWLTLSVLAMALWLFGRPPISSRLEMSARLLSYGAIAAFVAYNFAFLTTYGETRPTLGGFALLAIAGFLVWVGIRSRQVELTTPHLGILAAVGTSVAGAVLGVLLGIRLATGEEVLPDGGEDAHPATMVIGFLIPVGMALTELALFWPRPLPATRSSYFQIGLPFVGGILVMVGLLLDITPLVAISLPAELVGVAIYLRRLWPRMRLFAEKGRWRERFSLASGIALAINILLFVYLVVANQGDIDKAPEHEILALDHIMFIGVMTNAIFALFLTITNPRQTSLAEASVFVAMNIGLAGFALGLFFDVTWLKRISTPVLGAALLVAIIDFTMRLRMQPRFEGASQPVTQASPQPAE